MTRTYTTPGGITESLFLDAIKQPHLLICGSTKSGKSVIINGLIAMILHKAPGTLPGNAQLILLDPKRVELADYKYLPHTLAHAAGFNPDAWREALKKAVDVMDARYAEMERRREKLFSGGDLYVVIDEYANISQNGGKDCYKYLLRLTSEGRAARVHVILATQYPNAKILPTEIRGNFDWRFALRTNKANESQIAMDANGCENLPEYGYGFYCLPGKNNRTLYHIPMIEQEELDRLVNHWEAQNKPTRRGLFGWARA